MSLKKLRLPQAVVELPNGDSFSVRGLSLNDIAILVSRHKAKLEALFNSFDGDLSAESLSGHLSAALNTAPEVVAELIACASGDPDDVEIAASLPMPVQVDALEKTVKLTFDAGGGPKKFVETVVRLAQGTTSLLESLKT